jgi:DNA repair and recombination protein RAD52
MRPPNQTITPSKLEGSSAAGSALGPQTAPLPSDMDRVVRMKNPQTNGQHVTVQPRTILTTGHQQVAPKDLRPVPANYAKPTPDLPPPLPCDQPRMKSESTANPMANNSPTKESYTRCSSPIANDRRPDDPVGGFYSARAADTLRTNPYGASKTAPLFDPCFDGTSIRKTAGFNHNVSAPVARRTFTIVPPLNRGGPSNPSNINGALQSSQGMPSKDPINLSPDLNRRIGVPGTGGGFAGSTGRGSMTTSYRPPTRRSMTAADSGNASDATSDAGPPQNVNGKRPALADMTNLPLASEGDVPKRPKVGDASSVNGALQQRQANGGPS